MQSPSQSLLCWYYKWQHACMAKYMHAVESRKDTLQKSIRHWSALCPVQKISLKTERGLRHCQLRLCIWPPTRRWENFCGEVNICPSNNIGTSSWQWCFRNTAQNGTWQEIKHWLPHKVTATGNSFSMKQLQWELLFNWTSCLLLTASTRLCSHLTSWQANTMNVSELTDMALEWEGTYSSRSHCHLLQLKL